MTQITLFNIVGILSNILTNYFINCIKIIIIKFKYENICVKIMLLLKKSNYTIKLFNS